MGTVLPSCCCWALRPLYVCWCAVCWATAAAASFVSPPHLPWRHAPHSWQQHPITCLVQTICPSATKYHVSPTLSRHACLACWRTDDFRIFARLARSRYKTSRGATWNEWLSVRYADGQNASEIDQTDDWVVPAIIYWISGAFCLQWCDSLTPATGALLLGMHVVAVQHASCNLLRCALLAGTSASPPAPRSGRNTALRCTFNLPAYMSALHAE